MLARRTLAIVASRAGHLCMRATCKICMSRIAVTALRNLATKPARQESTAGRATLAHHVEEMDFGRVKKPLQEEIEHNRRLMQEQKLNIETVTTSHAKLIRENNISVHLIVKRRVTRSRLRRRRTDR